MNALLATLKEVEEKGKICMAKFELSKDSPLFSVLLLDFKESFDIALEKQSRAFV